LLQGLVGLELAALVSARELVRLYRVGFMPMCAILMHGPDKSTRRRKNIAGTRSQPSALPAFWLEMIRFGLSLSCRD
jgi:hypothetical protein